jgi:carbon storage regulator
MLMMSRRQGETILIGDAIEIVIAHVGRSRVRVGIRAPREMAVLAREVKLVREENLAAAAAPSAEAISSLLENFSRGVKPSPSCADEKVVQQDAGQPTKGFQRCLFQSKPT